MAIAGLRVPPPISMIAGPSVVVVTLNVTQTNATLHALAGSPASPGDYEFIVTAQMNSLSTGSWPIGSKVKLVSNNYIYGASGNRGLGSDGSNANGGWGYGAPGSAGGNALTLLYPITIDNTNGYIFGGGGGGGGGGGIDPTVARGGSGGFGQGWDRARTNGGGGQSYPQSGWYAGAGGNGGDWGQVGAAGAQGNESEYGETYPGGAGGAAGKAIALNGNSITWLGGNNGSQVKGAVS